MIFITNEVVMYMMNLNEYNLLVDMSSEMSPFEPDMSSLELYMSPFEPDIMSPPESVIRMI